jgi:hypothetical protein
MGQHMSSASVSLLCATYIAKLRTTQYCHILLIKPNINNLGLAQLSLLLENVRAGSVYKCICNVYCICGANVLSITRLPLTPMELSDTFTFMYKIIHYSRVGHNSQHCSLFDNWFLKSCRKCKQIRQWEV